MAVGEDLGLHQHVLVHLSVAPVTASRHHPPYMLQSFTVTSYMLASELRCSIILFHLVHLVLLGSVFDISDQLHLSASLIIFLYVIFKHVLFQSRSDDPLCTFSSLYLYTYWIHLYLIYKHALISMSMGMPTLDNIFFLIPFWWLGRLNSSEVLLSFDKIISIHLIHFCHHVPLLTSYIRGHLL